MLAGRDDQLATIHAALGGTAATGTSLLLRGDPGMGKTALLKEAETAALGAGLRVLRMTGAAAESRLTYAALHQVLWPLLDDTPALPAEQRDALESALGVRDGSPPRAETVADAALALLARHGPVAVLQDDLHWADPASLAVFRHLRRRTAPLPVVIIGATRDPVPDEGAIDLPPLTDEASERLLRLFHPWLPEGARHRVLRAAGGNPLALHELPARIREAATDHPAYLAGIPDLFDELPLGERLGRLYEDDLRALPAGTRHLLLAAALGGPAAQHADALRDMARGTPWTQALETASVLAHIDPATDRLEFRHPLVRAGLIHLATPAERRAAHQLFADTLPATSHHRIAHRAAAAVGTDAELAEQVHQEADRTAAQGEDAAAARMMARAAGLSPDTATRTARLIAAAVMATRAGRMHLAAELVAEAETEAHPAPPEPAAPYAYAVACTRFQLDCDPMPTVELLPRFLDGGSAAGLRDAMLLLLLLAAVHTGDERAWAAVERHATDTDEPAALCLRAWTGAHQGKRLREAVAKLPGDRETAAAWTLLWAAAAVDAVGEHEALRGSLARSSAYAPQAFVDSLRAHDDFLHGRWEESLTVSRGGAETSAAYHHALNETLHLLNAAQILAARGDLTALAELEPVLATTARERRMRFVAERFQALKVQGALGHGRAEEAWHLTRTLSPPGTPWSHLSLVDWVQAAVDSGRHTEARARLRTARTIELADASAHHAFLVAVAEALAAPDDEAEERYRTVYALPGARSWPFPLARAHLAHGTWLRRNDRPEQAAAHCRDALRTFTRLGATPWAEQASRELDLVSPNTGHDPQLSAQELRVAELAAQGLTNRQIGQRLGLSPRTIGAHLYRIFPKLGITTRAGVARALQDSRRAAAPVPEPPAR
ncbi:AAA family ATPase [Streptomyces cupreus]|uniref:Helix-turn-helix domain-containing protein n=1 Tax=Streptomyces cupreus TaxID=2759956 RepID=A0A7X1MEH8_9ACTN|nr:LuxR family transcriptional regulator [Streptomyces cupreus]MBC2908003.1 helix-turn-helix domain-containing protein [Streptomyces cupreus]